MTARALCPGGCLLPLHCPPLPSIALYCPPLASTALHCPPPPSSLLRCPPPGGCVQGAGYCPLLPSTALLCPLLPSSAKLFLPLPSQIPAGASVQGLKFVLYSAPSWATSLEVVSRKSGLLATATGGRSGVCNYIGGWARGPGGAEAGGLFSSFPQ